MVRNQERVQVRYKVTTRKNQSDRSYTKNIVITSEVSQKGQFQQKTYDQIN